ncbi:MAG: hypothetical protein H7Y33_00995 [Cytophagales bacterium]|nr:hypothetical protein [Rhizobacter sp.]
MKLNLPQSQLSALFASVALLTACGGGSDSPTATPPPPPAATTTSVNTTVIDGPLQNALVCLDKNDNGACEGDEPSARTAADGSATLTVPNADVGRYPLLAMVGTDAIDAVSGPVTTAYVLSAPGDRTDVVSPWTTLVKTHADGTGLSSTAAEAGLQDYAQLNAPSLMGNYSATGANASEGLGTAARLLVVTRQLAATALQPAVGTPDSSGAVITQTDIRHAIDRRLIELLPTIADTTSGLTDVAAGPAREAALLAAAQALATSGIALTPASISVVLGLARNSEPASATPAAGLSFDWFTYTDANNWYFRLFKSTAAQNTPDANGRLHFNEQRKRAVSGAVQNFGEPAYLRTDMYFNGTQWFNCPADFEHAQTARDANGVTESFYCGAYRNRSQRSAAIDISGRTLSDVVSMIRAYPLVSTQGLFTNWGPDPATPGLNASVFPAGSRLWQQTSTQLANPDSYGTLDNSIVKAYTAEIVAGAAAACGLVTPANAANYVHEIQTLEQLVAGNPGTPCVFTANQNTGPRNEWWGNGSVNIGNVAGAAPASPYYQLPRNLRIAFGSGNSVRYLSCALRAADGSPRNCDFIDTGTYSIETVGDARVMRFANVPGDARSLNFNRLFVERGGKVYYGFRTKLSVDNTLRLNATATDALLGQLGLSR